LHAMEFNSASSMKDAVLRMTSGEKVQIDNPVGNGVHIVLQWRVN
jgi:hypothetical protein